MLKQREKDILDGWNTIEPHFLIAEEFPEDYVPGPKNIPTTNVTPVDIWKLFFSEEIISHFVEKTNNWLRENNVTKCRGKKKQEEKLVQITTENILNYFALRYASVAVAYKHIKMAWKTTNTNENLFGNRFFQETMGVDMFLLIGRALQANLSFLVDKFNETSKKYWNMYPNISADDDLDRSSSQGEKIHNIKKADVDGVPSMKLADSFYYCFHLIWNHQFKLPDANPMKLKFGAWMLRQLESTIPNNYPYIFWIDAGCLGTYENAVYLANQGRRFGISCKSSAYSALFKHLHQNMNQWEWKWVSNSKMMAISWKQRQNATKAPKFVNWLTNMPNLKNSTHALFWDKKRQETVDRQIPLIRTEYNSNHGGVDHHHQRAKEFALRRKFKRMWKHKFWATLNSMLTNILIIFQELTKTDKKLDTITFLLDIVNSIRVKKTKYVTFQPSHFPPITTIILHLLQTHPTGKQKRCRICRKKTLKCCSICNYSPLHSGVCEIKFHNPNVNITGL